MCLKRFFFLIAILLGCFAPAFAQSCDTVSLPDSFRVCKGDDIALTATVRGSIPIDSVSWIPTTGLSDPHSLTPTLHATIPGYYKCIVMSPGFANLIVNGDFSAGNTGFTSEYTYGGSTPCAICPEGTYTVANNPSYVYTGAASFGDHTTGTGGFLLANGAITPNTAFWKQTVTVKPYTSYRIGGWYASWNNDAGSLPPPIIKFVADGVSVGLDTNFGTVGVWKYFTFVWTSGSSTTANLSLIDWNRFAVGNDFGVDDLTFREKDACADTDSVLISFIPSPTIDAGPDQRILEGDPVNITATGTLISTLQWNADPALSCDQCLNPVINSLKSGSYVITVTATTGCTARDTVNVTVYCDGGKVFVPNAFSPNGDGENDVFYPRGKGVGKLTSFSVFNRLGEMVFVRNNIDLNDITAAWNGNYKGASLKSDVYNGKLLRSEVFVYVIEAECSEGPPVIIKGDVTLLK